MSQPAKRNVQTATSFRVLRPQVVGNNLAICPPLPAGQSGKASRGERGGLTVAKPSIATPL